MPTIKKSIRIKYKLRLATGKHVHISKTDYDLYTDLGIFSIVEVDARSVVVAVSVRCTEQKTKKGNFLKPVVSPDHSAWKEPDTVIEKGIIEPGKIHLQAEPQPHIAKSGKHTDEDGIRFDLFRLIEQELSDDAAYHLRSRLGDLVRGEVAVVAA